MPEPKYEQEIRSILDQMDEFLPEDQSRPVMIRPSKRPIPIPVQPQPTASWLINYPFFVAALLVIVGRYVILPLLGPQIALAFGLAAGACIVLTLIQAVRQYRRGSSYERRWRGQVLPPAPSPFQQSLAQWWNQIRNRRTH